MKYRQFIYAIVFGTVLGAANVYAGGSCGETDADCHWEIENGVLTISGSGAMVSYGSYSKYPWYSQRDSYTSVVVEGANETTGTTGITSIGEYAFRDNNLTSVVISDSVTSIGTQAFYNNNLTSVVIPDSITSIGTGAFYNNNLTSVVIPDSVTSIGNGAFYENDLTSVVIPDSVTSIGTGAFNRNDLTSVVIPDSVTSIGPSAFRHNNNLTSVVIPDSVTSIESNAFEGSQATDLVCSAENLQRYLDAAGAFVNSGDINLSCTTGDCQAVLKAWDDTNGTNYASRAKTILTNQDGSKAIYDLSGKFLGYKNKRIYTIDEANQVAGKVNSVKIRYR